jgi:phosphate starvation-inducible protein PhoH and related proteins
MNKFETRDTINFSNNELAKTLFGENNLSLKKIADTFNIVISARGATVHINGDSVAVGLAKNILKQLYGLLKTGYPIYPQDIEHAVKIICADDKAQLKDIFLKTVYINLKKQPITPKSISQKKYIEAMKSFDIVFGIGPAGTGKTYLAMAMAVSEFIKKNKRRIILARPAVEAGEVLGFLPGDIAEKVDPYLRPLYDALHDMMSYEKAGELMENGIIEVAPLAFMRGRTLNDSFIILDEAQNTTSEQMKMFLTRIGSDSQAVITGDITQTDLPQGKISGLVEAMKILNDIDGIKFVNFSKNDVVRHKLVRDIIEAYEKK